MSPQIFLQGSAHGFLVSHSHTLIRFIYLLNCKAGQEAKLTFYRVTSIKTHPKEDAFLSASLDHSIRLWDLRSSSSHGCVHVPGRPVIAYDPEGLVFAVGFDSNIVKLYDVRSYEKVWLKILQVFWVSRTVGNDFCYIALVLPRVWTSGFVSSLLAIRAARSFNSRPVMNNGLIKCMWRGGRSSRRECSLLCLRRRQSASITATFFRASVTSPDSDVRAALDLWREKNVANTIDYYRSSPLVQCPILEEI